MQNYKICIEYDGTAYNGWQRQKDKRTVQETIEKALYKIFKKPINLTGAGRTDSGVHAIGQVANFKTESSLPPTAIKNALNANLPEDIFIKNVSKVPLDFHARYNAKFKWYRYHILNTQEFSVFDRLYTYHYPYPLNIRKMKSCAKFLIGIHNFDWLVTIPTKNKTRTVYIELEKEGDIIYIDVIGYGFFYKMVRRLCALLVEVGNGKKSLTQVKEAIKTAKKLLITTLPPQGLFLMHVYY